MIIMVVVLSFVGFVDSTDFFILEGGIGIFHIFLRSVFVPKNFRLRVHCGLRIFCSLAFGFRFSSKILV